MHAGGVLASAPHSPSPLFFPSWPLPYPALLSKGPIVLSLSNAPFPAVRRRSASPAGRQVFGRETVGRRRRFSRVWILIPPQGNFGNVSIGRLEILLDSPAKKELAARSVSAIPMDGKTTTASSSPHRDPAANRHVCVHHESERQAIHPFRTTTTRNTTFR